MGAGGCARRRRLRRRHAEIFASTRQPRCRVESKRLSAAQLALLSSHDAYDATRASIPASEFGADVASGAASRAGSKEAQAIPAEVCDGKTSQF